MRIQLGKTANFFASDPGGVPTAHGIRRGIGARCLIRAQKNCWFNTTRCQETLLEIVP
jgi:hypothetical protein